MTYGPQVTEWLKTWKEANGDALVPGEFLTDLFGTETKDSTFSELTDNQIAELIIYDLSMNQMKLDKVIADLYIKVSSLETALAASHQQQLNRATRRSKK